MSIASKELTHITLALNDQDARLREPLYDSLVRAVTDAGPRDGRQARVLDVGVGRGEMLARLQRRGYATHGIDLEPECVAIAGKFGDCRLGKIEDVPKMFARTSFDAVVCSHVLEHLDAPSLALRALADLGAQSYVLAVPNPLRPMRIMRAIGSSGRPDHPEHVHAWGKPEFAALLLRTGFVVDQWYADRVTINPLHGRIGAIVTRALASVETGVLPRIFPMLSSSLIVRCHLQAGKVPA
jgi:SAM-dependent methyltransferase